MKNMKRLVALLLVVVMSIGMTMTVMAENYSPEYDYEEPTDEEMAEYMGKHVYVGCEVAAGAGTVSKITDKEILASSCRHWSSVWDYLWESLDEQIKDDFYYGYAVIDHDLLFDVQGVVAGEVTVKLKDEGDFKAAQHYGKLAVVSHYNMTTKKWEKMKELVEVDANGYLTFAFDSYSPVMVSILNIKRTDLKKSADIAIKTATMTPQQIPVITPVEPKTQEEKVAYMSENVYAGCKIGAGAGTIAKITDKEIIASAYDQQSNVDKKITKLLGSTSAGVIFIEQPLLIDVQGVASGEVTVQLVDEGNFKASEHIGKLAVVSHYNMTTKTWEIMEDYAEIDAKGYITFAFNSYSPIRIDILNIKKSDIKEGSDIKIKTTTMTPQQVAAGASTKSPKMGE